MKIISFIFFFCYTCVLHAQFIAEKTYSAKDVTSINIIGKNIFKISVETKPIEAIKVLSRIEGEHGENVVLVERKSIENFNIETKLQPIYKDPNDKLSAHKVIAIEVDLIIPENLKLLVNLYSADINVEGTYKMALVNSNTGNCIFKNYEGDAKISTIDGNIHLFTNNARITSKSTNGVIKKENIDSGKNKIDIKTINGNITINKSQ